MVVIQNFIGATSVNFPHCRPATADLCHAFKQESVPEMLGYSMKPFLKCFPYRARDALSSLMRKLARQPLGRWIFDAESHK